MGTKDTINDHVKNIEEILKQIHLAGLKINLNKFILSADSISFLRHQLGKKGTSLFEKTINIMKSYKRPVNADGVRRFLGFIFYYKKYIPQLSNLLFPIKSFLKKRRKFE